MQITLREFIDELTGSGLLGDEQITHCLDLCGMDAESGDAEAFAQSLVSARTLTSFQADAVMRRRTSALVIGDYHVLGVVGSGGMGQVYKARHRILDRNVAIKVMHTAKAANPQLVQRFYREARAVARLTHKNIVTAYDAGETAGGLYLAMEFVDGDDLSQIVAARGPLAIDQAVNVTLQAARGLACAHANNMVHRDIKPANLLLGCDGTVKILDLGLARFTEESEQTSEISLTMVGKLMGTVEYMAPEHAANAKDADHRSDIYSLECTMHRILTGRLPYGGATPVEKLIAQREHPIPLLSDSIANVPEKLQTAFARMVAKKPADRYQSMDDCIADLQSAVPAAESCDVSGLVIAHIADEATAVDVDLAEAPTAIDEAHGPGPATLDAAESLRIKPESDPSQLELPGQWDPISEEQTAEIPIAQKAEPNKKLLIAAAAVVLCCTLVGGLVWRFTRPSTPMNRPTVESRTHKPPSVASGEWTTLPNGWRVGKVVNLGPVVNSDAGDGGPSVSADGRTMVFSSSRGGGQGDEDLWISSRPRAGAPWGEPANLGPPINTEGRDSTPSVSADGLTLVFQSNRAGGQGGDDLWVCTRRSTAQAWGPPVNLGPPVNSHVYERHPCLSTDGLNLIFVRDSKRGSKRDLWMSSRPSADAPWGRPGNLGPQINTEGRECGPCLSGDDLTLIFESNRMGGQGDFDLWMSARAATTKPFGRPVNLGASVNSKAYDRGACLSADGRTLYFHSNRPGGHGEGDIWQAPLLPPVKPKPTRASGKSKIYTEWPYAAAEAVRRRGETAKALGIDAELAIDLGEGLKMKFVLIPAGKFVMGSPVTAPGRSKGEGPPRQVTISKPFYMGVTEVTQLQWEYVMGKGKRGKLESDFIGPEHPIGQVPWDAVVTFCHAVSEKTGRVVRLPTEAQWEYACRAGANTRFSFGDNDNDLYAHEWCRHNSGDKTHSVGLKKPNPAGLYDMHGNVAEWCRDWYDKDFYITAKNVDPENTTQSHNHVLRGGHWDKQPNDCRAAARFDPGQTVRHPGYGFRVIMQTP